MVPVADPILLDDVGDAQSLVRLHRVHQEFDEAFLQGILAKQPSLLPVHLMRGDVGDLLCIGREVSTPSSGCIDNLYISTGGYPVLVETKLWRNPQARREVVSQVLDYVKEVVEQDFTWLVDAWSKFCSSQGRPATSMIDALTELADEPIDESDFVDRVHRALRRGDVIALIVGDGIETRLQDLVAHLCRDSAHLRYTLGLVELRFFRLNDDGSSMLILPQLVQHVEPVERAYVRIDVSDAFADRIKIESVADSDDRKRTPTAQRVILSEEEFFHKLTDAVGSEPSRAVGRFCHDLVEELNLEIDVLSSTLVLKVPDPNEASVGVGLIYLDQAGGIYNSFMDGVLERRWKWTASDRAEVVAPYYDGLHQIDARFDREGISHASKKKFVPINELIDKLPSIGDEMRKVVSAIRQKAEEVA